MSTKSVGESAESLHSSVANGVAQIDFPVPLSPATPAHIIRTDEEAIAIAHRLAERFAQEAAVRDRERRLPFTELEEFSHSGLWGISVPKEYGGAGVSYVTLAEVTAIISAADSSLGQIPQNHFYMVEAVRLDGNEEQKRFYFERALAGDRFGNAFCETGTKTALDFQTRLRADNGKLILNGKKFYSTGALFAHWIPVVAKDDEDKIVIAFVKRDTPGATVVDDWSSFGQRTTASGTAIFENVEVTPFAVIPHQAAFERPTPMGAVAQIIHAAVDVGIARAALADTIRFVRQYTRPWIDSGQEHGYEDPYTIAQIGDLQVRVHAADALLERAGRFVDKTVATPDERSVAEASVAVAEAKALGTEVSILTTNKLFELAGTRSTLAAYNLDRHWRNARTHTLHDPVRWKYHTIGNFWLNGIYPPRHGAS
jgi:SfnB family sulfur acquisition oxidoreductase